MFFFSLLFFVFFLYLKFDHNFVKIKLLDDTEKKVKTEACMYETEIINFQHLFWLNNLFGTVRNAIFSEIFWECVVRLLKVFENDFKNSHFSVIYRLDFQHRILRSWLPRRYTSLLEKTFFQSCLELYIETERINIFYLRKLIDLYYWLIRWKKTWINK